MNREQQQSANEIEKPIESREERVKRANEIYSQTCRESGLKISQWQDFPAWAEFVDGKIGEGQLSEKAKTELEQFSKAFGKYVVIQKEDNKHSEEDEKKRQAKQANKIYRQVCKETGLTVCFFHDFISWSQFVEGKIDDSEFAERVRMEVERIAAERQVS